MSKVITAKLSAIPQLAVEARWLTYGADPSSEYVRGVAEVLIVALPEVGPDDKEALIEWLTTGEAP